MKTSPKIIEPLFKVNEKIINNPLLMAIRNGFTLMIPFVMLGSFALVILSLPIGAYQQFMANTFGDSWKNVLLFIRDGTFNSFSLICVICVSYTYTIEKNTIDDYINPAVMSVTALASYMAVSGISKPGFFISNFGVIGVFIALFVAVLSSVLFRWLNSIKYIKINIFSDGANPYFNNALRLFMPAVLTIAAFAGLNQILTTFFGISDLQLFISNNLLTLFLNIHSSFLQGLVFIFLIHFFWIFGIHGNNMVETAAQGIFQQALQTNQALLAIGAPSLNIFTKTFFDSFVLMGGCGSMICLTIAILLFSKNKSQVQLSRFSIIPVLFNVNELMVFGIPIVLNPIFLVPFLCVPLLMTTISYLAMSIGLVPPTVHPVEWTTPILLSGYISTGSIHGSLLQLFNLMIGVLCYFPFVKLSEKTYQNQIRTNFIKVRDVFIQSETRGALSSLLTQQGSVGSIARSLMADLIADIEANQLNLYYQPIVDRNGKMVCMEALLRWKHPGYGFIYPPMIIGLAEEGRIMNRLGEWILNRACRDLKALKESGIDNLYVCVNISTTQLEDKHFIAILRNSLNRYQLTPDELEIEITERLMLYDNEKIKRLVRGITDMGIRLSIDDFGMGHSSLMYLKEYNFNTVKLDGSLVREIFMNENCRDIISSIVSLGKSINYTIIAEYVEDQRQREILQNLGCDLFQGYLFSKAVPYPELLKYIRLTQLDNSIREESVSRDGLRIGEKFLQSA